MTIIKCKKSDIEGKPNQIFPLNQEKNLQKLRNCFLGAKITDATILQSKRTHTIEFCNENIALETNELKNNYVSKISTTELKGL